MNVIKILTMCAAVALTAGTFAASALAAPADRQITITARSDDVLTERVSYHDLNLTLVSDEKRLIGRVRGAVDRVCPSADSDFSIGEGCHDLAWRGARPQIALAVRRAHEMAANGFSSIAPVAIAISLSSTR